MAFFPDQTAPSIAECAFYSVFNQPPGYEEYSCTESELDSPSIKQCCEQSNNAYLCTTCGSCAGENTAGNPSAPGQILVREDKFNQTCCSYSKDRGTLYYRNGTIVTNSTTGDKLTCDDRDDASCCKVGNGAANDQYACFYPADQDDTVPDSILNDDDCVCAMLSVNKNNGGDLAYLGPYCQERLLSSVPSQQPSLAPSQSSVPTTEEQKLFQWVRRPSESPSVTPSREPSSHPSLSPSVRPSLSIVPSVLPSDQPSIGGTMPPSLSTIPTLQPSHQPSLQPSSHPSIQPSSQPSSHPSSGPSSLPSAQPSSQPSAQPTEKASLHPSSQPSSQPSHHPSDLPSSHPSDEPSSPPSSQPSAEPSVLPSSQPSSQPSSRPSHQPSSQPSHHPSSEPSGKLSD